MLELYLSVSVKIDYAGIFYMSLRYIDLECIIYVHEIWFLHHKSKFELYNAFILKDSIQYVVRIINEIPFILLQVQTNLPTL